MRRWRLAPGGGAALPWVALSVVTGLLAAGCAATAPVTGPAHTTTAPVTATALATGPSRAATTARAGPALAHQAPTGFWFGSDSWPIPVSGSAPYRAPGIGGAYGGYVGMAGSWSYWLGCHGGFLAWSSANSAQADTNYTKYGQGIGTAVYWFMGGPGVDPGYNGTAAEAAAWGARQAARTLANMAKEHVTYPVVFMDIELPGVAPAFDNGWEDVYSSPCSGQVKHRGLPVALNRADFNGFWSYIGTHSGYRAGVYSDQATWTQIFGTGSAASIPHTYEWTYEPETASLAGAPHGWCLKPGGCAAFFGGVTTSSPYALMWQWSGGGGVRNAIGDFDQIDASRNA
jgi:hypothetical protein